MYSTWLGVWWRCGLRGCIRWTSKLHAKILWRQRVHLQQRPVHTQLLQVRSANHREWVKSAFLRRGHLLAGGGGCRLKIRCDRRNDCGDGSDERGCTYQACQQHQFTCQNGRCISRDFVCDGDNDCGDESDELEHMCHTPAPTCPPGQFRCDNGHCISPSRVCDRNDDCSDNSDEKGCGESAFQNGVPENTWRTRAAEQMYVMQLQYCYLVRL